MKKTIWMLLVLIITIYSSLSKAQFSVDYQDVPEIPTEGAIYDPVYGNSQNDGFKKSLYGLYDDFSEQEKQEIISMIPEKQTDRFFIKLGFDFSNFKIKINNRSNSVLGTSNLANKKISENKIICGLAWGYRWSNFFSEIEYLLIPKIKYNQAPLFKTRAEKIESKIERQIFLLNGYYTFEPKLKFELKPYVGLGLGGGINRVSTTLLNGVGDNTEKAKRSLGQAFNISFGLRFELLSNFILNGGFRYTQLPTLKWIDNSGNLKLKGKNSIKSIGLNLIWLY